MITLTINDAKLEQVYYENFEGDDEKFIQYLSESCTPANNVEHKFDAKRMEKLYDEGEASGNSGLTHDEVFDRLRKKYDIDKV
jgi:hypothetical protein